MDGRRVLRVVPKFLNHKIVYTPLPRMTLS